MHVLARHIARQFCAIDAYPYIEHVIHTIQVHQHAPPMQLNPLKHTSNELHRVQKQHSDSNARDHPSAKIECQTSSLTPEVFHQLLSLSECMNLSRKQWCADEALPIENWKAARVSVINCTGPRTPEPLAEGPQQAENAVRCSAWQIWDPSSAGW